IVFIAFAAGLNYVGPFQGWFQKYVPAEIKKFLPIGKEEKEEHKNKQKTPETDSDLLPESLGIEVPDQRKKSTGKMKYIKPVEPQKTEMEKKFDAYYDKFLAKLGFPEPGKKYKIFLRSGGKINAELVSFSKGKVVLKLKYGEMIYPVHNISPKSYKTLFPERVAKIMALKAIHREIQDKAAKEKTQKTIASSNSIRPKETASSIKHASITRHIRPKTPFVYDPSFAPTPEHLKKLLVDFGNWIKVQQHRTGGKIANKIYAKKQGQNTVLYLVASRLMQAQDYDLRFRVTEGMWKLWSFRALEYRKVSNLQRAHVVILDQNNKIIGGSTKNNASSIWVKK
ncbi:MAG: hypothetical protein U9O87_09865, partial [Verrucomicrobiota bacterium]|nr:hypothetical protein [Verrucomicrobiota bacterium]